MGNLFHYSAREEQQPASRSYQDLINELREMMDENRALEIENGRLSAGNRQLKEEMMIWKRKYEALRLETLCFRKEKI